MVVYNLENVSNIKTKATGISLTSRITGRKQMNCKLNFDLLVRGGNVKREDSDMSNG